MSLSEIERVQITEDGDEFLYEVSTKEVCFGNIRIILSKSRNTASDSVIEGWSEWNNSVGTIGVKKELLKGLTDLYVYLKDENTQTTGTAVRVYYEALALKSWYVTKERELVLLPERGKNAYEFSKELVLFYQDAYENEKYVMLNLPNARIGLEQLDLWEDSKDFTFQLGYGMEDEGVKIYGAFCPPVTACIAPPEIKQTAVEEGKIVLTGYFTAELSLWSRIYSGGQFMGEVVADKGKLDVSKLNLDEEKEIFLEAYYKTEQGESLHGDRIDIILKKPVVESCIIQDGNGMITLERSGTYEVSVGEENKMIFGRQFQLPVTAAEFSIGFVNGKAKGPKVCCQVMENAVYSFQNTKGTFYLACGRPDACSLDSDIVVELDVTLTEGSAYQGTCFQLEKVSEKTLFTMKKEIFTLDTGTVHEDYRNLMSKTASQKEVFTIVKNAILENLPMEEEEILFYNYDYCPESGYVGIFEGMSLMTEYTMYQNIPDAKQSNGDLNGYTGTGTARYQVIGRDGNIKLEPFAGEMNFVVAPPKAMTSDNKLCGGAGIADLLYKGFSSEYMRLVYPTQFTDRNSTGNLCYDRNICLLSCDNWKSLLKATENMRKGGLGVDGCAYHYFRGRAVVIPQICICVSGNVLWVSLGTRLLDVQKSMGLKECSLFRMVKGEKTPVKYLDVKMPLVAGDCIEL